MEISVQAEKLTYSYDGTVVLNNLSFTVRKGEFFIVIGPNGSGKTTLMKIIAGLIKNQSGELEIKGQPIKNYKRKILARQIAFVPQQVSIDFPFIVSDVVLFGRSPHLGTFGLESSKDINLAKQAMKFTEVGHLAGRRLNQLSGGECQRVFIARAICQDPDIIVLDEPTASLDIAHQLKIMDMMEKMKQEKGITVIMVSHDVNLAAIYADTLMLINQGELVKVGPPGGVLTYKTLEAVYGCPLLVDENPLDKLPRVTPVPGRYIKKLPGR
ncbi:MAG: ABC transporter ATP-binding protein [Desulfobacteraceae bacterium]|nr:ABC transporter ATP-binding protein [Desulfobacteraceae bacterium]MBC2754115.1 ABC transporter ATP-binding protein [Desulfobacteraceae bacterium]